MIDLRFLQIAKGCLGRGQGGVSKGGVLARGCCIVCGMVDTAGGLLVYMSSHCCFGRAQWPTQLKSEIAAGKSGSKNTKNHLFGF